MTVGTGARSTTAGDGVTVDFTALFQAKDETHLTVTVIRDSDGAKTAQVLNTDYTVSFTNSVPKVTFITAPASGFTVLMYPAAPLTQVTSIANGGSLFGSSIEEGLDRNTINIQDLQDRINLCLQVPRTDQSLDALVDDFSRKDKYLYFNATTGQPEMKDLALIQADLGMLDDDLADIAALTPLNDDVLQRKAGEWTNRTVAEYMIDMLAKRPDGAVGAPNGFLADTDTGYYRPGVNQFAIATGGTQRVVWDADGNMLLPTQPAFSAYANSDILNVTGNGTDYVVQFNTEIVDRNNDFNTSTGIFTAPVTGLYTFSGIVSVLELGASDHVEISLITSNRTYLLRHEDPTGPGSDAHLTWHWEIAVVDMDAAGTAKVNIVITGLAGDTVDLDGGADMRTSFAGRLVG